MAARTAGIEEHPDIMALRMPYEKAAESRTAQAVEGLGFLAGLYLAVSPWVVGFSNLTTLTVNNLITGIALMLLAVGFASAFGRTHGMAWVAPVIGVWTIVSPWVVSGAVHTTRTIWSNVVVGAVALILGLGAVGVGLRRRRM